MALPVKKHVNFYNSSRLREIIVNSGVKDQRVLDVMLNIPREVFVSPALSQDAYKDLCLPIGEQQTISMPSIVALMTERLCLRGYEKILEIGTGCGYQTAVLSKLCKRVYTVERISALATAAVSRLNSLKITNFTSNVGDGTIGWALHAPYDGIIVTAAGPKIPEVLINELKVGGKLVMPLGDTDDSQKLICLTKNLSSIEIDEICSVSFVPLIGKNGVIKGVLR